jgi:hypothetical protein
MAVTSACSAELIAVSSLFSYDIYKAYFRPMARGPEIVRVSHFFICFWAVWMGCWATILHKVQIDLGWLFYVQGVVLSPAVIPIALTVTWRKLTRAGVLCGALVGAVLGMLAWMIGCWKIYGAINIPNLANPYSAVCSGLTGLLFSGIITVSVSLISPANYDFQATRAIANLDVVQIDDKETGRQESPIGIHESNTNEKNSRDEEEQNDEKMNVKVVTSAKSLPERTFPADMDVLKVAFRKAMWYSLAPTGIVAIIVPLPMFFSHYIYSEKFYTFWAAISIIWALLSGTFSVLLPVWERRMEIALILSGCWVSLSSRRARKEGK